MPRHIRTWAGVEEGSTAIRLRNVRRAAIRNCGLRIPDAIRNLKEKQPGNPGCRSFIFSDAWPFNDRVVHNVPCNPQKNERLRFAGGRGIGHARENSSAVLCRWKVPQCDIESRTIPWGGFNPAHYIFGRQFLTWDYYMKLNLRKILYAISLIFI